MACYPSLQQQLQPSGIGQPRLSNECQSVCRANQADSFAQVFQPDRKADQAGLSWGTVMWVSICQAIIGAAAMLPTAHTSAELDQASVLSILSRLVGVRIAAKTVVAAETIGYLGHLISATACQPEEAKVAAIKSLSPPTTVKRLQAHLGLFNYYRVYVPEFSRIAQPLYRLTAKDAVWDWTDECQQAYDQLKSALCTPGLALRQPDPNRPFHLFTDWSQTGLAAVLQQKADDDSHYLVACASRSLNAAEQNYPAWKGEMLAAVWGVRSFRPYLHARDFYLHTDHRPLLWLLTHKMATGQQMRWILALQEYRFTLVHRAGCLNPADVPSREPLLCAADSTGARLDEHAALWPLPTVLHSDFTLDTTPYTHEGLTQDLGITTGVTRAAQALRSFTAIALIATDDTFAFTTSTSFLPKCSVGN